MKNETAISFKGGQMLLRLLLSLLLTAPFCFGDQLAWTFIGQSNSTVVANASAFSMGGSSLPILTEITDTTRNISIPFSGFVSATTGASADFTVSSSPNLVTATYAGSGANSVLITDGMGHTLLSGTMSDGGKLLSSYPEGTGAFLAGFTVDSVSPSVLAAFGLAGFLPRGAFSSSFGSADVLPGPTLDAIVGGGTVTIQATAVREPTGYGLLGTLLLVTAIRFRRLA